LTEEKLRALFDFEASDALDADEKLVLRYAEALTATPMDVPDELYAALRARFEPGALVELTSALAWQNYRARFDHAFEVEAQGFSEGGYCPLPGR